MNVTSDVYKRQVQTVDFFDHIVGVGGCDPFSEFVPSLFRFGAVSYTHLVPFEDLVEVSGEGIMDIDVYLGIGEE